MCLYLFLNDLCHIYNVINVNYTNSSGGVVLILYSCTLILSFDLKSLRFLAIWSVNTEFSVAWIWKACPLVLRLEVKAGRMFCGIQMSFFQITVDAFPVYNHIWICAQMRGKTMYSGSWESNSVNILDFTFFKFLLMLIKSHFWGLLFCCYIVIHHVKC